MHWGDDETKTELTRSVHSPPRSSVQSTYHYTTAAVISTIVKHYLRRRWDLQSLLLLDHFLLTALFLGDDDEIVRTIRIDRNPLELPRIDMVFEEDVKVGKCQAGRVLVTTSSEQEMKDVPLWLRKTEKGPGQTEEVDTGPEESSLATPAPRGRIHHEWHDSADNNARNVVDIACKDDRLDTEAGGRNLRNKGVAYRPNGDVVSKGEDEKKRPRCPGIRRPDI